MAIQIIPKEAAKLPLWQNILFYLSIASLLACFLGFGILFQLTKKAEVTLEERKNALIQSKTTQMVALEEEILDKERKIRDFSSLIESHQMSPKFFELLERNTHPKVFFSELGLEPGRRKVTLSGQTDSFQILGQQILIFQEEAMVEGVQLSTVGINKEGKIEFTLGISFSPLLFK